MQRFKLIQTILAASIFIAYVSEITLIIHPNGGYPVGDVRHWYHQEVGKINKDHTGKGRLTKTTSITKVKDVDGNEPDPLDNENDHVPTALLDKETIMDGGVKTKFHAQELEFYGSTICEEAERAVEIRKNARYAARKRGTAVYRMILYMRDRWVHGSNLDWNFEHVLVKEKKKYCAKAHDCVLNPPTRKDLCGSVYESAQRTNKAYDNALLQKGAKPVAVPGGTSEHGTPTVTDHKIDEKDGTINSDQEEDPYFGSKDMILGILDGYAAFVFETTVTYSIISVFFMTFFTIFSMVFPGKDEKIDVEKEKMEQLRLDQAKLEADKLVKAGAGAFVNKSENKKSK